MLLAETFSHHEQTRVDLLEIVCVDEAQIVDINKEYLDRDYITDVITFSYDDPEEGNRFPDPAKGADNSSGSSTVIEGTLYCCVPRILEQAKEWNQVPSKEFSRVIIHGLLHLLHYKDHTPELKEIMRKKEDQHLAALDK